MLQNELPKKKTHGGENQLFLNILNPPCFQISQHTHPELVAFVFANPDPQDVLVTLHVHAQHHIRRLSDDGVIVADLQWIAF